ncbi:hypothetical protein LOY34_17235 [Pseudomonas sp. B21-009]|uniref:hypothetical protein n=1 Tax=Pseudomonas sp. B21-009 TaxID=2895470 RepID=UPI00216034A9|nr:hypothetical protein [Pseudomonas sp. B21-009]UVM65077.1 hypothetical protein LOY34_17235 [Pseudomonas sp. B21-009]
MVFGKVLSVNVHVETIKKFQELVLAREDYKAKAAGLKGEVPDTSKVDALEREVLLRLGHHTFDAVEAAGDKFLRLP